MSEYEYDASGYFCSIAEEHGVKVDLDAFMGKNPESYYAFSILDDFNDQIENQIEEIKKDLEREYDDPEDAFLDGSKEFSFIFYSYDNDPGCQAKISFNHVPTVAEDFDYIQEELLKQNELPTTYEEAWELAWRDMENCTVTFTHDSVAADIDRYGKDDIIEMYEYYKAYVEADDEDIDIKEPADVRIYVTPDYSIMDSYLWNTRENLVDFPINTDWFSEHDIDPEDYDTTESAYEDIREAIIKEIDEEVGILPDPDEDSEHAEESTLFEENCKKIEESHVKDIAKYIDLSDVKTTDDLFDLKFKADSPFAGMVVDTLDKVISMEDGDKTYSYDRDTGFKFDRVIKEIINENPNIAAGSDYVIGGR